MLSMIYWNPNPEIFTIPYFNFPILWYGVFFALGFWLSFWVFVKALCRAFPIGRPEGKAIADRLMLYIVIGTILGARIGHFLFYESPTDYLSDPLEFFRFRNGGLASHGAVIGVIFSILLFSYRIREKYPKLDWLRILDLIAIPAPLAGACIRIGNFFNQEILGVFTNVPWAVYFGRPIDGAPLGPRHPAQLYEAIAYLGLFFFLWHLSGKVKYLLARGRLVGLVLSLLFVFRFFIEFVKTEQSQIFHSFYLTMGQVLSIPAVLLGALLYAYTISHK